ncbi:hypothetical protein C1752_02191 [Acaryochloris thomasi RCC1774]|uniref:NmrA-like domain-containing protein n=1 Tax=Acaryochloris thomasi RCC1774 TaxID=1764569 RepID=A0A2W1JJ23_9CYAN|nr:NmrA family NAD(P)-binding protein [Acaryochloris thomasi]PZD73246.1 hypothetical protein C1752_02191 [Acaryochloris thomasi RCC1774]
MTTESKTTGKKVLLIGGTGDLGGMIAQALLERGASLRLYVRPGSRSKLPSDLEEAVEIAEDESQACTGMDVVISAIQGGPDVIVDKQLEFLATAKEAGVKRFIPSDFSFDLFKLEEGENINSDWRCEFAHRAETERGAVAINHILNGCFLDRGVLFGFLGAFDLEKNEAYLWGDGNTKMDFTTYADTAAYTAAVALSDEVLPNQCKFAGESLTFHELLKEVSDGLGRPISIQQMGTLADLDTEIANRQKSEPDNTFAWLPLMYWRAMLNGKGKLEPLMNSHYPSIQPMTVQDYTHKMTVGQD